MRQLSINDVKNISEVLIASDCISNELGESLLFTYKNMMQAIKDRDSKIKKISSTKPNSKEFAKIQNKLLRKIEKLEADMEVLEKEKAELYDENKRLMSNNGEILLELKPIHNDTKNVRDRYNVVLDDKTEIKDDSKEEREAPLIIRGISTRLYNALLRYMAYNNILDKYDDKEQKLEEFIIKHESLESLHIKNIGKQSIEEYDLVRRRLMKAIIVEERTHDIQSN